MVLVALNFCSVLEVPTGFGGAGFLINSWRVVGRWDVVGDVSVGAGRHLPRVLSIGELLRNGLRFSAWGYFISKHFRWAVPTILQSMSLVGMIWVVRVMIGLWRVCIAGDGITGLTRIGLSNGVVHCCIALVICLFFTIHCDTIDFYPLISLKVVISWVIPDRTSRSSAQSCGRCDSRGRDYLDIGSISRNRWWRTTVPVGYILLEAVRWVIL